MPFVTRKSLLAVALLLAAVAIALGLFVWSGVYNIGADDTHTKPVHAVLQTLREKSIAHHARGLEVPDLTDAALIRSGAGNYDAMCTGCHLSPGAGETELSKGLYPAPPNFSRLAPNDPRHDFWVIKHGVKASGMPAWGKSMEDRYIWGMVALLQQMPKLGAAGYKALVASSGGHSHGGGETGGHHDAAGEAADHHDNAGDQADHGDPAAMETHPHGSPAGNQPKTLAPAATTHVHADGETHVHESLTEPSEAGRANPAPEAPADRADGHDHQH